MMRNLLALLLTGALAFWSLGCEADTGQSGEPGSAPKAQEPGSPPDDDEREPGS